MDIVWEDIVANMQKVKHWLEIFSQKTDLIVFPEMFLTGFSMEVEKSALSPNDENLFQLKQWAVDYQIAIAGSIGYSECNCIRATPTNWIKGNSLI